MGIFFSVGSKEANDGSEKSNSKKFLSLTNFNDFSYLDPKYIPWQPNKSMKDGSMLYNLHRNFSKRHIEVVHDLALVANLSLPSRIQTCFEAEKVCCATHQT